MNSIMNQALIISMVAWFIAQTLKVLGGVIRDKRLDVSFFVRSGGMPSSHTALVSALATSVGILEGFNSIAFTIAFVFAGIVMYDAAGVRRAVSKQSIILNRILQELMDKRPKDLQNDVRQLIGHTPFQVFTGGILGIAFAVAWLLVSGDLKI